MTVNSAGEIAMIEFETVENIFLTGLENDHHLVRNAIQGSLKKSGEKILNQLFYFVINTLTAINQKLDDR
jgi:hypothetical protein